MFNVKNSPKSICTRSLFAGMILATGIWTSPIIMNAAQAATSLSNTSWEIVGFGKQTLQFDGKNNIGGQAGCNNYSASYKMSGKGDVQSFEVGPVRATRKMCFRNSVMMQEKKFLTTLEKVKKLKASGNKLQLLDGNGSVLATFVKK